MFFFRNLQGDKLKLFNFQEGLFFLLGGGDWGWCPPPAAWAETVDTNGCLQLQTEKQPRLSQLPISWQKLHDFWKKNATMYTHPRKLPFCTWKWTPRRGDSFEKPSFLGSMLVFGGVSVLVFRVGQLLRYVLFQKTWNLNSTCQDVAPWRGSSLKINTYRILQT